VNRLRGVPHIEIIEFTHADIVRDEMCQRIAERYEQAPS
jgi:phosphate starvation-inducible protein PhoH